MTDRLPFLELARRRVVVLDGAMGTSIHNYTLDLTHDWMGQENISEVLVLSRPDLIGEIHESFLAVGCDAVETNTFGANKIVLAEAGMAERTLEINQKAAEIARKACDKFESAERPRYVVGSIGPGTKLVSLGNTTYDVMEDSYAEQCRGLLAGGVDVLLIETAQDLLQIKCAISAATIAMREAGRKVPLMVQASFDTQNKMLLGSDAAALVASIEPFEQVDVLGLNCATGPVEMGEHVQYLARHWPRLISVLPNAGLPITVEGKAHFPLGAADFATAMGRFVAEYGVNIVGGCCGTTPRHMAALVEAVGNIRQSERSAAPGGETRAQVSSLTGAEDLRQDLSYLVIAERTNTNGSRQFKRLLQAEDWDGLVSMARDEVREGAHMLDVCVDFVGRDGVRDMHEVVSRYVRQIPAPLMLDSTSPAVMETGLKLCGGRCALNSMNLEDGEGRVAEICALAKKYGAAVVAGTIDEDKINAMARTAARKVQIATRIRGLAVEKYGLRDRDILFDPLVLPVSTGIEEDRRNALETIEGIRQITAALPDCHTVVGLSNVSFGLKPAARVVLNSVFLHECRAAGLTAAIVHGSRILPENKIAKEQWQAALDLVYDRRREGFDPLTHFVGLFPDDASVAPARAAAEDLTIEEALKRHIIDGEKRDLGVHLDQAMTQYPPLEIINNILLEGMKVVGELFGAGKMQLPFVLQSAETMKAAVRHLEPFLEKLEGQTKGKIVLATVKGDVHDIGKNLVDIILSNNGYTVYNLGIKQPINEILREFKEKRADAIGMSGLLVKSVGVMKENVQEMNAQGVSAPVLLGGAALTRSYAVGELGGLYQGNLLYCKDAFEGLAAMDRIVAGEGAALQEEQRAREEHRRELAAKAVRPAPEEPVKGGVAKDNPVPAPPFWGRREVTTGIPLEQIFAMINTNALFLGQWEFKKKGLSDEEHAKLLEEKARPIFLELQRRAAAEGWLEPKVVWGYFPCQSQGEELIVYHTEEFTGEFEKLGKLEGKAREWMRFAFPRQTGRRRLCIADFFRSIASGQYDVLGVQLVTLGDRPTAATQELFAADKYADYLYLHGFCVESAEGLAELWHKRMRQELGFGNEDSPRVQDLFQQGYRGSRYSFGYGACPNLEDRAKLCTLLRPESIGVNLSESFMLVPEQTTDAIVVHHPQAKYFDT